MLGEERRIVVVFHVLLALLMVIHLPVPVDGDGCYVPVGRFEIYEPGQFGLVCWNGTVERLYLSINIWGGGETDGVHFVPFPSLPVVSLGNISVFDNLTSVLDKRLSQYWEWDRDRPDTGSGGANGGSSGSGGYQIEYDESLGIHDVTIIKVIDLEQFKVGINSFLGDMEITSWPDGMDKVIEGYVERGFPYFAIDRFSIGKEPKDIEPLVYEFETDEAIFPLEISSPLEGYSQIKIGCLVPNDIPIDISGKNILRFKSEGYLSEMDLERISPGISSMFSSDCLALYFESHPKLSHLEGDFMIRENCRADWMTTFRSYCSYSAINEDGSSYERILTNGGYLDEKSDELQYIDPKDGDCKWVRSGGLGEPIISGVRKIHLSDLDQDGIEDVLIIDYNRTSARVNRIDPETGDTFWVLNFTSESNYDISLFPIMDPDGMIQIALNHQKGLVVINLDSGEMISRLDTKYQSSWLAAITVLPTQVGDKIVYGEPYESSFNVWDPWRTPQGSLVLCERFKSPSWPKYEMFQVGHCAYLVSQNGQDVTVIVVNDILGLSKWEFNGVFIDWIKQDDDPSRPLGIFKREGFYNFNEIMAIDLLSFDTHWDNGRITPPGYSTSIELRTIDIDNDGSDEILLNWYPYFEQSSNGMELVAGITILDQGTGEVVWTKNMSLVDHGLDSNSNYLEELLIENEDKILLVEPSSDSILKTMQKDEFGLTYSFIQEDVNSDGHEDSLFITTDSISYWVSPWKRVKELVLFDGLTGTFESMTGDLGAVTNAWRSTNDKDEPTIIVSTFRRIYCFPIETHIQLLADKIMIGNGKTTNILVTVANSEGPMIDATLKWRANEEGGSFSTTKDLGQGQYLVTWTAPDKYEGEVLINVKVDDGEYAVTSQIVIDVINGMTVPIEDPSGIGVKVITFPKRVQPGGMISITATIEGEFLVSNIVISLLEITGNRTDLGMVRITDHMWTIRFWPEGPIGEKILLFKAMINEILVHEELINVALIEEELPPVVDREIPIIQLGIPVDTILRSSKVPIIVQVYDIEISIDGLLRGNDGDFGGSFSKFLEILPGIWTANYTVPDKEGVVNITVFLEYQGKKIAEDTQELHVVSNGEMNVKECDLLIHHTMVEVCEEGENTKHVFISTTRNGRPVNSDLKLIYLTDRSWTFDVINEDMGNIIHLKIVQKRDHEGLLILDISDGEKVTTLYISLIPKTSETQITNPDIVEDDVEQHVDVSPQGNVMEDYRSIFLIVLIMFTCAFFLMGITIFLLLREKKIWGKNSIEKHRRVA